jgi:site-specific recombinase XerC
VFVAFSAGLDSRVADLDLSQEARQQLEAEKVDLGAAEVPQGVGEETAAVVDRAIAESFVTGFRVAMFVAAGLALVSSLAAAILIEGKGKIARTEEAGETGSEAAPA